jgi:hypothetical protein
MSDGRGEYRAGQLFAQTPPAIDWRNVTFVQEYLQGKSRHILGKTHTVLHAQCVDVTGDAAYIKKKSASNTANTGQSLLQRIFSGGVRCINYNLPQEVAGYPWSRLR